MWGPKRRQNSAVLFPSGTLPHLKASRKWFKICLEEEWKWSRSCLSKNHFPDACSKHFEARKRKSSCNQGEAMLLLEAQRFSLVAPLPQPEISANSEHQKSSINTIQKERLKKSRQRLMTSPCVVIIFTKDVPACLVCQYGHRKRWCPLQNWKRKRAAIFGHDGRGGFLRPSPQWPKGHDVWFQWPMTLNKPVMENQHHVLCHYLTESADIWGKVSGGLAIALS